MNGKQRSGWIEFQCREDWNFGLLIENKRMGDRLRFAISSFRKPWFGHVSEEKRLLFYHHPPGPMWSLTTSFYFSLVWCVKWPKSKTYWLTLPFKIFKVCLRPSLLPSFLFPLSSFLLLVFIFNFFEVMTCHFLWFSPSQLHK